ncbi:MAG: Wzz/FepE/Etk N-terminal domain-containing protein [Gammaproteobacteria bacterium]|nr:Wzz/FepE/Etk N-terminal domain-containing protein [Gammaproteobacteria bacterium]
MDNQVNGIPGQIERVDELTFIELIRVLQTYRILVAVITATAFVLALLFAILSTPVYRAEVVIAPASETSAAGGLSSIMSRFASLPGLGGLSRMGRRDKVTEGIATLGSPNFTIEFIADKNLLPVLFSNLWDAENEEWDVDSKEDIPTLEDGYYYFDESIREIIVEDNGLILMSIEWKNPVIAADWANELISRLNEKMRTGAITEANKTIDYLNEEVEKTRIVELQQAIYFMIENQINLRTMANVRKEFAFKIISAAIPPDIDRYVKPQRLIIIAIGLVAGFVVGVFLSFLLYAIKRIRVELEA